MTIICEAVASGDDWTIWQGDCVEILTQLPDDSVDFSVYSPPFANLYVYSESERDMGNVEDDEAFQRSYAFVCRELLRVTKPGRLCSIHVKDLTFYSNASDKGDRGLQDFTGSCTRTHIEAGWTYHSKVTVWRCPVSEQKKSKPDGLLYKNFRQDAGRVRQGLPEYIVTFRKWADGMDDTIPVLHLPGDYPLWAGEGLQFVNRRALSHDGLPDYRSLNEAAMKNDPRYHEALDVWQNWASPVWMTTDAKNVLNVKMARSEDAERHLCPMPLDLTERCIRLWSNPGEIVFSPFTGIGSEGHVAMGTGRKFIGIELNCDYFRQAAKNLKAAEDAKGKLDLQGSAA